MRSVLRILDLVILLAVLSLAVLYFKRECPEEFELIFGPSPVGSCTEYPDQEYPYPSMGIEQ